MNKLFFKKPIIRFLSGSFEFIMLVFVPFSVMEFIEFYQIVTIIDLSFYSIIIYYFIVPYITNGQTLGQFIFGLKTVSLKSKRLSFLQIVSRQTISWFGFDYIFEVLGIKKLTNEKNQLHHDRFCCTTVISKKEYDNFCKLNIKEKTGLVYKISMLATLLPAYMILLHILEMIKGT